MNQNFPKFVEPNMICIGNAILTYDKIEEIPIYDKYTHIKLKHRVIVMAKDVSVIGNDTDLGEILNRDFTNERKYYIEVGPEKIVLPGKFEKYRDLIENFEVRDDDVFILAFPKTGSRWTQEMVWLLLNNLNFEKARDVLLHERSPLVELETLIESLNSGKKYFDDLEKMCRPRLLRSHLQWTLLPKAIRSGAKQPKIVVVLRGPEDTCTSYFHQATVVEGYAGTFDSFCKLFLGGKVPLGPYWKHVTGLWEQRNNPNIMFVKYTQMKNDLAGTIRDVAAFLGKKLSEQDVVRMAEFLTFDNLKESKGFNMQRMLSMRKADVNPYIRKGQIGGHKSAMTPEVIEAFQRQSDEILNDIGLSLD